jgi:hypothetical protein
MQKEADAKSGLLKALCVLKLKPEPNGETSIFIQQEGVILIGNLF